MEMKIEIISRETIRPSFPTPDHLKPFKLSIFDQFSPAVYSPVILFYANTPPGFDPAISRRLKTSLSDTLTRFYPFAGRIRDNKSIDCGDHGVDFLEARVSGDSALRLLTNILDQPDPEPLTCLLPVRIVSPEAYSGCLLLVQTNYFESGGLAIGVSMSHKLADAATLSTFIKSWACSARDGLIESMCPDFSVASVFPPSEMFPTPHPYESSEQKLRTRRYLFDAPSIAALKVKCAGAVVPRPTRVEAVCALLWKCKMSAMRSKTDPSKPSVLAQTVNLRKRVNPPIPEDSVGNLLGFYTSRVGNTYEAELPSLVVKMRKSMEDYLRDYALKLRGPESFSMILKSTMEGADLVREDGFDLFIFTSWCRLGLYDADFGWGKPDWTSSCSSAFKNTSVLMDAADGKGVEAWVTLREEDMESFEWDRELLSFATPNRSLLVCAD